MAIYECVDVETGDPVEAILPMAEAPDIGGVFSYEGRKVRRVPSLPQAPIVDNGFVSRQPARWHPDAPAHTPDGWCAFKSDAEAREFCKKNSGDGRATMEFEVDD